jgi:hypothetical protein
VASLQDAHLPHLTCWYHLAKRRRSGDRWSSGNSARDTVVAAISSATAEESLPSTIGGRRARCAAIAD